MFNILKRVTISNTEITVNDMPVFTFQENQNTTNALKEVYRYFKMDYLKFFKMDNLSKLGFLSAEILLKEVENKENMSILFGTSSSSLETDTAFQETIKDTDNFFPSPSVFVYTLPNIVIGEICIRHKIYGENMMFIVNENNISDFYQNMQYLINAMGIKKGIIGYLDCYQNSFQAELILFEQ
ncbi:MAG: 3-oxoacyl-ACP synthase [Bacteroidetes bacterium]|nr:3-oxoacyl-ACP synthase [Bacteroidota bacterium]